MFLYNIILSIECLKQLIENICFESVTLQSGIFARNLTHNYNKPFFLYEGVKIKRFFFFLL